MCCLQSGAKRAHVAVQSLTFGIKKGECLGFVGVHGAGKTTTLKILSGDILPSNGCATINGYNLLTEMERRYF